MLSRSRCWESPLFAALWSLCPRSSFACPQRCLVKRSSGKIPSWLLMWVLMLFLALVALDALLVVVGVVVVSCCSSSCWWRRRRWCFCCCCCCWWWYLKHISFKRHPPMTSNNGGPPLKKIACPGLTVWIKSFWSLKPSCDFHCTGSLTGILIIVDYNPFITGQDLPLYP